MKKGALIFPPQWLPVNPYSSVPILAGQIQSSGYVVICQDYNLDFYDYILSSSFLTHIREKLKDDNEKKVCEWLSTELESAIKTIKYGQGFYDVTEYRRAMNMIEKTLALISRAYPEQEIKFNSFIDHRFQYDYKNLDDICSGKISNIYYPYMWKKANDLMRTQISYICISVTCSTQIIAAFTLAWIIRRHTNIVVCMGGNYINRVMHGIKANQEIFRDYCHHFLTGDGEISIVKYVEFLHNKCDAKDVPGLVRLEQGKVFFNPVDSTPVIENFAYPIFTGMRLKDYYCPELCFPIEFARGCYWGKCSFCAVDISGKKYCEKSVSSVVQEIKYLSEHYGIHNFVFTDEAIPVNRYLEFADSVLENNLDIHYYSFARLERSFSVEVLRHLRKSGLMLLWWGYESASARILRLMNKGIDAEVRITVLENAYNAGIWNHCLCMVGFPSETSEEVSYTFRTIKDNRKLFNSCAIYRFFLAENSSIYQNPGKYGIESIAYPADFEYHCAYQSKRKKDSENLKSVIKDFMDEYARANADTLWPVIYDNFDHLLMYLIKYGCEAVREYNTNTNAPLLCNSHEE